jgi:hypothetical protein
MINCLLNRDLPWPCAAGRVIFLLFLSLSLEIVDAYVLQKAISWVMVISEAMTVVFSG